MFGFFNNKFFASPEMDPKKDDDIILINCSEDGSETEIVVADSMEDIPKWDRDEYVEQMADHIENMMWQAKIDKALGFVTEENYDIRQNSCQKALEKLKKLVSSLQECMEDKVLFAINCPVAY